MARVFDTNMQSATPRAPRLTSQKSARIQTLARKKSPIKKKLCHHRYSFGLFIYRKQPSFSPDAMIDGNFEMKIVPASL